MTDAEVRAAAEVVRDSALGWLSCTDLGDDERAYFRGELAIARDYLAEHAADDGEPTSPEWLWKSCGWDSAPGRVDAWIQFMGRRLRWLDGTIYLDDEPMVTAPTRGHVRALARALGVPLPEPPHAPPPP